jgi:hypothetical protein
MEPAKIYRLNREKTTVSSASLTASAPASTAKPKLLDQVRQAIRTRHLSPHTEQAYVGWIRRVSPQPCWASQFFSDCEVGGV